MKVKIFESWNNHTKLETEINDWLEFCGDSIEVVNIEYNPYSNMNTSYYSAMIVYKEKTDDETNYHETED